MKNRKQKKFSQKSIFFTANPRFFLIALVFHFFPVILHSRYPILLFFHFKICRKFTFQSFALNKIQIVGLLENTTFKTATQAFEVAPVNVEHESHRLVFFLMVLWQLIHEKLYFFKTNENFARKLSTMSQ